MVGAPWDCKQAKSTSRIVELRLLGEVSLLPMSSELLSSDQAAQRLGITVPTLYDWLGQSDAGEFVLRGQSMTISYFQGGRRGQGRIQIEAAEVDRIQESMRVRPQPNPRRRSPTKPRHYPGIIVPLGHPED